MTKCFKEVMALKVRVAKDLLCRGSHRRDIRKALLDQFGIQWRAADRAIRRAREELLVELETTKEEQQAIALANYKSCLVDPEASVRDRIAAQDKICKLLALYPPPQAQMVHVGALQVTQKDDLAEVLNRPHVLKAMNAAAKPPERNRENGNDTGRGGGEDPLEPGGVRPRLPGRGAG